MLVRRIYGILAAVCLLLAAVSCASEKTELFDYQSGLREVSLDLEYGLVTYSVGIAFDGDIPTDPTERRAATVTFTAPEEITGLVVKYTKDTSEASVGKVKLDLPENTGEELYLVVRLFNLYPEELAEKRDDGAKFRATVNGRETEFDLEYSGANLKSADITWDTEEIKVRNITVTK